MEIWARIRCHRLLRQCQETKLVKEYAVKAVSNSQASATKLEIPKPQGGEELAGLQRGLAGQNHSHGGRQQELQLAAWHSQVV